MRLEPLRAVIADDELLLQMRAFQKWRPVGLFATRLGGGHSVVGKKLSCVKELAGFDLDLAGAQYMYD